MHTSCLWSFVTFNSENQLTSCLHFLCHFLPINTFKKYLIVFHQFNVRMTDWLLK